MNTIRFKRMALDIPPNAKCIKGANDMYLSWASGDSILVKIFDQQKRDFLEVHEELVDGSLVEGEEEVSNIVKTSINSPFKGKALDYIESIDGRNKIYKSHILLKTCDSYIYMLISSQKKKTSVLPKWNEIIKSVKILADTKSSELDLTSPSKTFSVVTENNIFGFGPYSMPRTFVPFADPNDFGKFFSAGERCVYFLTPTESVRCIGKVRRSRSNLSIGSSVKSLNLPLMVTENLYVHAVSGPVCLLDVKPGNYDLTLTFVSVTQDYEWNAVATFVQCDE